MLQRIVALAILGAALAGCGSVQLRTAPEPLSACDDALASGRLVSNEQSGLALQATDGTIVPLLWPFGYTARRGVTGIELLDNGGAVLAREGDFITAGGGTGNEGVFAVCPASVKVVPAPG
jgi:uncharacterized protein YceK